MIKTIVLLGEGGVGKSALSIQYTQHHFTTQYDPTIENTYRKQTTIDGQTHVLQILDTAGQEEYRMMVDQYIRSADGIILVCGVDNLDSLHELDVFQSRISMVKDDFEGQIPVVIAANKCDIVAGREISAEALAMKSREYHNAPVVECSAKTRLNVDEVFAEVVRRICVANGESGGNNNTKKQKRSKKNKGCTIL